MKKIVQLFFSKSKAYSSSHLIFSELATVRLANKGFKGKIFNTQYFLQEEFNKNKMVLKNWHSFS